MKTAESSPSMSIEADHGMIPLSLIDSDGKNVREPGPNFEAAVEEKVASFKMPGVGQLHPICLYRKPNGRFLIGYGHLRVEAARRCGWEDIRAEILPMPADEREIYDRRDRENLDQKNLTPLEEMLLVDQCIERCGGDLKVAAGRLGKSIPWVRAHSYVSKLDESVKFMLRTRRLDPGHARELAKLADKDAQRQIAEEGARKADGSGTLRSVDWFKAQVERRRRSLKVVEWELSEEFAGKPKCSSCPANSANDQTLFEMGEGDGGRGYCMNGSCYEIKASKSHGAIVAAVRAVETRAEATGGMATMEMIKHAAPSFVKPSAVAKAAKVAEVAAVQAATDGKRKAFATFVAAFDEWRKNVARALFASATANPDRWIAFLLLSHSSPFIRSEHLIDPDAWQSPIVAPDTSPALQRLVTLAGIADPDAIRELAEAERQKFGQTEWREQPAIILTALALAWGVEIPAQPELEHVNKGDGDVE